MKRTLLATALIAANVSVAQAKDFTIDTMTVSAVEIQAPFFPTECKCINLNVITGENLVGGYISAMTSTVFGPGEQILYTAAANQNPQGSATPAGVLPGGPVPSGSVNMKDKTITVDMSSMFSAHVTVDQNLGGIATGSYQPGSGEYTMSWTATATQGNNAGQEVTFIFKGNAYVVPARNKMKKFFNK